MRYSRKEQEKHPMQLHLLSKINSLISSIMFDSLYFGTELEGHLE